MTQITISIANEAKYKALLAFIAQEGDIFVETPPKNTKKASNNPKINLNDFWGAALQPQTITDIDNQLTASRQAWDADFYLTQIP
ncbi:MAG: hypothetical protein RI894_1043 [Bacteroidota bacterium]|jgi:hypothetical protein